MEEDNPDSSEDDMMHVVGVTWKESETGFQSGITYRNSSNDLDFLPLSQGTQIAWTIKGPKICIGRIFAERKLVSCPLSRVIVKGTKCRECLALDAFEPCIRCTGHTCGANPDRRDICRDTDYVVYLAVFADGGLKVGVSSKSRVRTRWVEQGADYAGVLAELKDGKEARKLEYDIGKHPAIQTVISGHRKRSSILQSLTPELASSIVDDFLGKISKDSRFLDVTLENLLPFYRLEKLEAEPVIWPDGNRNVAGRRLLGEVVGMKGSLLVTTITHAYRLVSLKRLIGYTIEEGISTPVNAQSGLLDYF